MADKVRIYSTPTCPFCIRAKQFLKDKGIEFEDIDISADSEKVKEVIDKTGQAAVPVLDIDGKVIIGFDKEKIEEALG